MGIAHHYGRLGDTYIFLITMTYKYSIKTDCFACLGVVNELIKQIPGVSGAEFDSKEEKIIIDYNGKLTETELAEAVKEKTCFELISS